MLAQRPLKKTNGRCLRSLRMSRGSALTPALPRHLRSRRLPCPRLPPHLMTL